MGLLDGLDEDLDRTGIRLSRAQRTMDRVSKGAKDNCELYHAFSCLGADGFIGSTLTIAMVILILLLLIIVFKT